MEHHLQRDGALDQWVRGRNKDSSELRGDTTLTKEHVKQVQAELSWNRARNNRIAQEQTAALASVEAKIAKAIQSTQNLDELKTTVAQKCQEARAESVRNTAEIRIGIRNLSTRPPPPPTAEECFKENEDRAALQNDTGLDLDALLQYHDVLLQDRKGGRMPPRGLTVPAGFQDDSDPCSEPTTPRRCSSSLPRRKCLSSEEEENKSMAGFAKLIAVAFQQLKKDDDDRGNRIPLMVPERFDWSFNKFRRWLELINEYIAIYQKGVPNDQTKIYSPGTFLRDQAADWYAERKRWMKALHLNDNWVAFSAAIEDQFTDRHEIGKDHEKLLAH